MSQEQKEIIQKETQKQKKTIDIITIAICTSIFIANTLMTINQLIPIPKYTDVICDVFEGGVFILIGIGFAVNSAATHY